MIDEPLRWTMNLNGYPTEMLKQSDYDALRARCEELQGKLRTSEFWGANEANLTAEARKRALAADARCKELESRVTDWMIANGPNGWIEKLRVRVEELTAQLAESHTHYDVIADQLEACRRDSERYRWLRQNGCGDGTPFIAIFDGRLSQWTGKNADAQVDAAISARNGAAEPKA